MHFDEKIIYFSIKIPKFTLDFMVKICENDLGMLIY